MIKYNTISKIINRLIKEGFREVTVSTILSSNRTEVNITRNDVYFYIDQYVRIGFSKSKSYTVIANKRAKVLMNLLIKHNMAEPYDYGRGKGKYRTTGDYTINNCIAYLHNLK